MMKIAGLAVLLLLSMLQWPTHSAETAIQLDADEPFSQAAPPPAAAQRAMVSSMSECHALYARVRQNCIDKVKKVYVDNDQAEKWNATSHKDVGLDLNEKELLSGLKVNLREGVQTVLAGCQSDLAEAKKNCRTHVEKEAKEQIANPTLPATEAVAATEAAAHLAATEAAAPQSANATSSDQNSTAAMQNSSNSSRVSQLAEELN